jgi:endonuclease/exonuclease/phosphatase family metal-dependent hydrolase
LKDVVAVWNEKKITFFRGISASRLDRFYVSDGVMNNILETATKPTSFSDHQSVILRMRIDPQ